MISAVLVERRPGPLPPGVATMSADDGRAERARTARGAISSIDLVRALLWIVAAIIVGAVVYLSALERQRDFAVLKAVGASNRALLGSLALQAVLVALRCRWRWQRSSRSSSPQQFPLPVTVPPRAFWQLPLLAVIMALVAGAVGMRKVLKSDPSQAFCRSRGMTVGPLIVSDLVVEFVHDGYAIRPLDNLSFQAQAGRTRRVARTVGLRQDDAAVVSRRHPHADERTRFGSVRPT